jgi:protein-L-isoaspartate O-methyltransferase
MTGNVIYKFITFWCCIFIASNNAWETRISTKTTKSTLNLERRALFPMVLAPLLPPMAAQALDPGISGDQNEVSLQQQQQQQQQPPASRPFVSAAFPKKEYTNSIVASRDTNISPLEVYETILRLKKQGLGDGGSGGSGSSGAGGTARALDVGAGAGVSTQVIFQELGYLNIDAVDWSGDAWRNNVVDGGYCPPSVNFYELDDERFVEKWTKEKLEKYDIIAFNFAVNKNKALYFSKNLLKEGGLLLAPVNAQQDYWLKQTYQLFDVDGNVVWSAADVGAWSVQFQPDVTQDTCQGVWCSPFNGFQKMAR